MQTAYSKHSPSQMHLQGGVLVPVDIEPVEVSTLEGETETHYKFNILKFQEIPTSEMIEKYQSVGADVQAISEKHPDWLQRLPNREIDRLALAKLFNGAVLAQNLTDDERAAILGAYDEWSDIQDGETIQIDSLLAYQGQLYNVVKQHQKQADWNPRDSVSLFAEAVPEGVVGPWEQPESTNPYMTGDKVTFEGHLWESKIDNNVWSPATYPQGWEDLGAV